LARSLLALERYDQAEQRLQQALGENADNAVAINLLGEVYRAAGRLAEAREQYQKAIALRPGAPLAYERVARLQLADGDSAAAVDTLEAGIEATEGNRLLTTLLPVVLQQAGRYDEAIDAYEAVLAASPDANAAANNLAMLLVDHRAGDAESLARAQALVQRFEGAEQAAFLDTLGWVYYRSGDYARAAEVLEQVQASGEMTPERQYHLGMAYLKLGRTADARALLAAAVGAEEPFPGVDEARAALESL
jgi:Flp pilus assembly protein TadD